MNYSLLNKKHNFYVDWYKSLSTDERVSIVGQWILNNINIYHNLLKQINNACKKATS